MDPFNLSRQQNAILHRHKYWYQCVFLIQKVESGGNDANGAVVDIVTIKKGRTTSPRPASIIYVQFTNKTILTNSFQYTHL